MVSPIRPNNISAVTKTRPVVFDKIDQTKDQPKQKKKHANEKRRGKDEEEHRVGARIDEHC